MPSLAFFHSMQDIITFRDILEEWLKDANISETEKFAVEVAITYANEIEDFEYILRKYIYPVLNEFTNRMRDARSG